MTYISVFVISIVAFVLFGDKKRFYQLYVASLVGMAMSLASDIVVEHYPLWQYHDPDTHISMLAVELLDDFGIYPVLAYLYVQGLPKSIWKWIGYTLIWTIGGIGVEYILNAKGYMTYHLGWTILWSYLSNWIIFGILSLHHFISAKRFENSISKEDLQSFFMPFPTKISNVEKDGPLLEINSLNAGFEIYRSTALNAFQCFFSVLEPEQQIPPHQHPGYEIHHVLEGELLINVNRKIKLLKKGETFHFCSEDYHSFMNHGKMPVKFATFIFGSINEQSFSDDSAQN